MQEVIEAAGHFSYQSFIVNSTSLSFLGCCQKYLRDNCDYTFDTLKPKTLASVQLQTIWRWEHWMFWWMDAYRASMGITDAQKQVKKFSSTKYKS
jgi:hypothetical protein